MNLLTDDAYSYILRFIEDESDIQAFRLCSKRLCRIADTSTSSLIIPYRRSEWHGGRRVKDVFFHWCSQLRNIRNLTIAADIKQPIERVLLVLAHQSQLRVLKLPGYPLRHDQQDVDAAALYFCNLRNAIYQDLHLFESVVFGYTLQYSDGRLVCVHSDDSLFNTVVSMFRPRSVTIRHSDLTESMCDAIEKVDSIKHITYVCRSNGPIPKSLWKYNLTIDGDYDWDTATIIANSDPLVRPKIVELVCDNMLCDEVERAMTHAPNIKSLVLDSESDETDELFPFLMRMFLRYPQLKIRIFERFYTTEIDNDAELKERKDNYVNLTRPWYLFRPFEGRLLFDSEWWEKRIRCVNEIEPSLVADLKTSIDEYEATRYT